MTPPNEDTCRGAANAAWEVLDKAGANAYEEYWTTQDPPPNKCKQDCKCSSENYLATFDWDNETMIYVNNGSNPGTSKLPEKTSDFLALNEIMQIIQREAHYFK